MNELQLMKQRSNSEAHLHLSHLVAPLGTINESCGGTEALPKKQNKGLHRTPGQRQTSKLRQPTKFNKEPQSKAGTVQVIKPDRSAPQIAELPNKQKTSQNVT